MPYLQDGSYMTRRDAEYASPQDIADGFRESDEARWEREQRRRPSHSGAMRRMMAELARERGGGAAAPDPERGPER